jgi:hypothetical protein
MRAHVVFVAVVRTPRYRITAPFATNERTMPLPPVALAVVVPCDEEQALQDLAGRLAAEGDAVVTIDKGRPRYIVEEIRR